MRWNSRLKTRRQHERLEFASATKDLRPPFDRCRKHGADCGDRSRLCRSRSGAIRPATTSRVRGSDVDRRMALPLFLLPGIAHWAVGRLLGIRFAFYTIGGTGNPEGYPAGMRWVFEHLPFFSVQTDRPSMQKASPKAKAFMWSAGVTSSAVVPTLSTVWAWRAGIPGSKLFLIFAVFWAIGTLSSNWRSQTGDYAKARRALHR